MCKRRFSWFPPRRQRARLPALQDAAAYFHARIICGVKKECHTLLDNRVRSRHGLPERLAEVRRGGVVEVDHKHRGILLAKELQELLRRTPSAVRVDKLLEALRRASMTLNQAEEPKRMHQLSADHA